MRPVARGSGSTGWSRKRIRVLIVDDHPVVCKGLASFLGNRKDLVPVGEAADGEEALAKARQLSPDVVLMDIELPKLDGLTATQILREENSAIKVILFSMYNTQGYGLRIIQSGARGYVSKDASPAEFTKAVQTVASGGRFFGPDVVRAGLDELVRREPKGPAISPRERQVLTEIAIGWTNKEIASHLGVGVRTVETHRERIMRKLNIHNIAGLTKFAITSGLIPAPMDRLHKGLEA